MSNGIFGIQPWAVFLLFVIIALVVFIYLERKKGGQKFKKYENKVITEFWDAADCKTYLCEITKDQVDLPKEHRDKKNKITGSIKKPSDIDTDVDRYFVMPEAFRDVWWPPERKRKDQIKLKKIAFTVGICLPMIIHVYEKWTTEMLSTQASQMIGLSEDEHTLEALNAQDHSFWNNLDYVARQLSGMGIMKIASFVAAGAGIIVAFLVLQLSSKVDAFLKVWGG